MSNIPSLSARPERMTEPLWADPTDATLMQHLADFISSEIIADPAYISHGEVQSGLSPDGRHWHDNLPARMREDLLDIGPDRDVIYARQDGQIAGAAIILWVETPRTRFAVIEDMAVARPLRSTGLGGTLLDTIEDAARARGMKWLFLESGLQNEGAHKFFERGGFKIISKVFSKPL